MDVIEAETALRRKNQITLPEAVARELGVEPGDHLVFTVARDRAEPVTVRRLPRSYAGIAAGVYGTPEEAVAYLRKERASWGE